MKRMLSSVSLTCVFFGAWLFGCGGPASRDAFSTAGTAARFTLYEGLPHQALEFRELEHELKTRDTVSLQGFPFYKETLELSAADAEKLRQRLTDASMFRLWEGGGIRKCGGFHPDYCVEWEANGQTYQCLLCFGCDEAWLCGPDKALRFDIAHRAAENALASVLKPYRKNRPKTEHVR